MPYAMLALIDSTLAPSYLKPMLLANHVVELGMVAPFAFELSKFWSNNAHLAKNGQLSLAVPKGFWCSEKMVYYHLGTGNLRDETSEVRLYKRDEDFTEVFYETEFIRPTWLALEERFNIKLYRPVIRLQATKTCLSYHRDASPFRLHVVLHTHDKAMFIVDDVVKRMPKEGFAYLLRTDVLHTAVNADLHLPRVHLTFSGNFKD
jgi:hypothetical protein